MQISTDEISQINVTFDLKALEELVSVHGRRLHNFVRRRIGNMQDVEDIVQDTLLEAVRCRENFRHQSRPETWLFGIAANLIRNHYKRARAHDIFDELEEEAHIEEVGRSPAETFETIQLMERVSEVIDGLSNEVRSVFGLVFDEQMTYEEAAARLGIPVGTVRSRISRARLRLKELQLL
ncbi:RNA polymerase sigma factor [Noviherbaspirillum saxi]|nr:RNA polymerase sigma factor [Noviherbaspirillum saxi]